MDNNKAMTYEEFQEKVKAIPDQELVEMAQKVLSKLCSTGGQSFTMTVPPKVDDTDIILSEVIKRFEVLAFLTA
jgi:predicted ATP-grasp superfamily ATP-dependent carboligase